MIWGYHYFWKHPYNLFCLTQPFILAKWFQLGVRNGGFPIFSGVKSPSIFSATKILLLRSRLLAKGSDKCAQKVGEDGGT